jgi:predicted NAD-dependent protein-ADP-ribosyltransferase YbiA (DUF1768 family)
MNWIAFNKTREAYGWMSNMSQHSITYDGVVFPRAEHLFIWLRLEDPSFQIRAKLCSMGNPKTAKIWSKKYIKEYPEALKFKLQSKQDVDNMRLIVQLKCEQYPELVQQLLATGDLTIYEDVTNRCSSKDSSLFWGAAYICSERENTESMWVGNNMLGKIWMKQRQRERNKLSQGIRIEEMGEYPEGYDYWDSFLSEGGMDYTR